MTYTTCINKAIGYLNVAKINLQEAQYFLIEADVKLSPVECRKIDHVLEELKFIDTEIRKFSSLVHKS